MEARYWRISLWRHDENLSDQFLLIHSTSFLSVRRRPWYWQQTVRRFAAESLSSSLPVRTPTDRWDLGNDNINLVPRPGRKKTDSAKSTLSCHKQNTNCTLHRSSKLSIQTNSTITETLRFPRCLTRCMITRRITSRVGYHSLNAHRYSYLWHRGYNKLWANV